jgi:hypothetical protein
MLNRLELVVGGARETAGARKTTWVETAGDETAGARKTTWVETAGDETAGATLRGLRNANA